MPPPTPLRRRLVGLWMALPWALWYAGVLAREAAVRAAKDPADYDGYCTRLNGLRLECSLERWLEWDLNPLTGILMFAGALLAAAASGAIWLWCQSPSRKRSG